MWVSSLISKITQYSALRVEQETGELANERFAHSKRIARKSFEQEGQDRRPDSLRELVEMSAAFSGDIEPVHLGSSTR